MGKMKRSQTVKHNPSGVDSTTRRRWLAGAGTAAVAVFAGCLGDDDTPAGGSRDEGSTEDRTEDDAPGDEMPTDDDDSEDGDTEDDSGETDPESDVQRQLPDSFEMEGTMTSSSDPPMDVYGRVYGDDMYMRFTHPDGPVFEIYRVDSELYSVSPQGCVKPSGGSGGDTIPGDGNVGESYTDEDLLERAERTDRTTLDGHEVYVYEVSQSVPAGENHHTFWVDMSTGYIRQHREVVPHENVTTVVEHFNWNGAAPVTAPDMDCQEF